MRCIIIDDDYASRNILIHLIKQIDYLELTGICSTPMEGLELINKGNIDLVFLDIEMPEMTGIDMLNNYSMPPTIITTMHKEYALDAFEHNIIDYLVKPITLPRFLKAAEKAKEYYSKVNTHSKDYFFIKKDSVHNRVPIKDVSWIEALGDYVTLYTPTKKYLLHITLKAIEPKLPHDKFIRVHRSYIVNMDCIDTIEETTIYINKKPIPIGIRYKENLFKVLNSI
jgi:two-component system LytT family response regulator